MTNKVIDISIFCEINNIAAWELNSDLLTLETGTLTTRPQVHSFLSSAILLTLKWKYIILIQYSGKSWHIWVGRRKEPILGYVPKIDETNNMVHKGLMVFSLVLLTTALWETRKIMELLIWTKCLF